MNSQYSPPTAEFEYDLYPEINKEAGTKTETYKNSEKKVQNQPNSGSAGGACGTAKELMDEIVKQIPLEILFYKLCGKF